MINENAFAKRILAITSLTEEQISLLNERERLSYSEGRLSLKQEFLNFMEKIEKELERTAEIYLGHVVSWSNKKKELSY